MVLNKKAILFTFISILIASLLTMIYASNQTTPLDENVNLDRSRVKTINNYVFSLITYSQNSLGVSGYRALQGMINYYYTNSPFSNEADINQAFNDCVINGTLKGLDCPFMTNLTITRMIENVKNISKEEFGFDQTDITINNLWIDQNKAFAVTAYMNITVYLSQRDVLWNVTTVVSKDISIAGLKDPLYFSLPYNSTFKETLISLGTFNYTNFEIFVNDSEYISSQVGLITNNTFGENYKPMSFFGRLANSASVKNDPYLTLISVLSPKKLEDAGIPRDDQPINVSYVDFLYYKEYSNCLNIKKVKNDNSDARIDDWHARLVFGFNSSELDDLNC